MKPNDRNPRVRPSLPPWKQASFHFSPMTEQMARQFHGRIRNEQDMRIFCVFGMPGPMPVGKCHRPVLADGWVFEAGSLRAAYVDPFCPAADMHHARSLLADAVLMRARRTSVSERQLRDMAPMMAQAAIEPFAQAPGDPAAVMVRVADEMAAAGMLSRGTGQGGARTYTLTDMGRVRVEEHVWAKWWVAVN